MQVTASWQLVDSIVSRDRLARFGFDLLKAPVFKTWLRVAGFE
jgi:hypothetical protein